MRFRPGARDAAARAVAVLAAALLAGCAWNDHGLARVEHLENGTARLVRLDVWGAHLVTGSEDAGLTLGRSRREYVYPRAAGAADAATVLDPAQAVADDVCRLLPVADPSDVTAGEHLQPVVIVVRTEGLSLDLSGTRIGVHLGLRRRAQFRVSRDSDVLAHVRFDSRDPASRSAYLQGRWK